MNKFEYTISTQVIGTEDGRVTYEVRKTLNNENGKRCVIIALYPTVSLISPCVMDNSTLFLINRANELGYNDFRIVNIYSKVCKGKPSVKQLNKDVEVKTIVEKMLDEMGEQLEKYKEIIEGSEFSVHKTLTLASIVELEGASADDRAGVAGVFYNRVKD